MRAPGRTSGGRARASRTVALVLLAVAGLVALAACQGASRETVVAGYERLAEAANTAYEPLIASLASTSEPAARAPILRGLADAEKAFADGLSALPASGDVKIAADEVVRLSREREAAFRAAAAATGPAQAAALAPIMGAGGDAFQAAVGRLRVALGLPPAGASPSPSASPTGATSLTEARS
jgi:hypothetical protein